MALLNQVQKTSGISTKRRTKDLAMTVMVFIAFLLAVLPLASLLWTVIGNGINRFDVDFFSSSMRNVVGAGGGRTSRNHRHA